MTDDELDAIEDRARRAIDTRRQGARHMYEAWDAYRQATGPNVTLALVAEVRRLRALQCPRAVTDAVVSEEPMLCHEYGRSP